MDYSFIQKAGRNYFRLIFCYLTFFLSIHSFAQVNINTGSAVQSLPIFNFSDNLTRLNLPILLNYNSGTGLKVDEVANDVGQGWGLMAGGKITRIQIGEPDDQKERPGSVSNTTKYPAGYYFGNQIINGFVPKKIGHYPVFPKQNTLYKSHNAFEEDKEMDYFALNVNGVSAMFVIPRGSNEGVFLGTTLMKVKVNFIPTNELTQTVPSGNGYGGQARTAIKSFELIDDQGLSYLFETKAYQKLVTAAPSDRTFENRLNAPKKLKKSQIYHSTYFDDGTIINPWIVNEWYLTSIRDLLYNDPNRKINFNYSYRYFPKNWQGVDFSIVSSKKEYAQLTGKKSWNLIPVLTDIQCPNNYSVSFNYGNERFDLPKSNSLASITVNYRNRYLQRHLFEYKYVIFSRYGNPIDELQKKASRLYLISLKRQTADLKDADLPIRFDYYLGGNDKNDFVPPPFYYAKDIYGYYNGFNASEQTPANRSAVRKLWDRLFNRRATEYPDYDATKKICFKDEGLTSVASGKAKNGLLKTIYQPGGGWFEYIYEQNKATFTNGSLEMEVGGVHVSETKMYDGRYNTNCEANVPIVKKYRYIMESGSSSLWGVEQPINNTISNSNYKPFGKKWRPSASLPFTGKCTYSNQYPGIMQVDYASNISGYQNIVSSPAFEVASQAAAAFSTIKAISAIRTALTKGGQVTGIVYIIIDVILTITETILTCFVQDDTKIQETKYWFNYDLNSSNPLPQQYSRVEIMEGNGQNGKIVEEFTGPTQYPLWQPVNTLYDRRQRFAPWAYGLPFKTTILDASNKLVKVTENDYFFENDTYNIKNGELLPESGTTKTKLDLWSCHVRVVRAFPEKSEDWAASVYTDLSNPDNLTNNGYQNGLEIYTYNLYTGRVQLRSAIEKIYDQEDDEHYLQKTTRYTYEYANYSPTAIEETGISGETKVTYTRFLLPGISSGTSNATLNKLISNNIYTIPYKVTSFVRKAGLSHINDNFFFTNNLIGFESTLVDRGFLYANETETDYSILNSGLIAPSTVWARRTAAPVANINSLTKIPVQFRYYGANGLLTGVVDEGGRQVVNIYDYTSEFKIATLINANPNPSAGDKMAFSSFENGAISEGGWNSNGISSTLGAVTGKSSLSLSGTQNIETDFVIPLNGKMILSFYASSPSFTISGAKTSTLILNTAINGQNIVRNGLKLYHYTLTGNGAKINISGATLLDEVRLYPEKSRISTVSYDPLVGKISDCDQNNRITYYEYDTKGRIKLVKDDEGNVVKVYEYNEIINDETCNKVFLSHTTYELVQRNNCGPNQIGGYFEWYIAEGTFTSTLSQDDADSKLDKYIADNAQYQANLPTNNVPCITVYSSEQRSLILTKDNCPDGYIGQLFTYTVPSGRYTSTISQEDANDQADEDIDANAQWEANNDPNTICIIDNAPKWEADEQSLMRCEQIGGVNTGKTEVEMKDVNPNSLSLNVTQWVVLEENILGCVLQPPVGNVPVILNNGNGTLMKITFLSQSTQNALYTFNNVGGMGTVNPIGEILPGLYDVKIEYSNFGGWLTAAISNGINSYAGSNYSPLIVSNIQVNADNWLTIDLYY